MAITSFSGPVIVFGQNPGPGTIDYNPDLGPSMFFDGVALLDPRPLFTYSPGQAQAELIFGFLGSDNITTLSAVPATAALGAVAISQILPANGKVIISTFSSSILGTYSTPGITRSDTGAVDSGVGGAGLLAIDAVAACTGSIANGVLTVTSANNTPLSPGMAIYNVAGAISQGSVPPPVAGSSPASLLTITGLGTANGGVGTYNLSKSGLTAASGTISLAYPSPQFCATPFGSPPSGAMWNPQALIARQIGITAAAGATGTLATVTGYDVYGFPMTEQIAIVAGAQAVSKKAWKYIRGATIAGGDTTHAYSLDTVDGYGLPLRSDSFADLLVNEGIGSQTATALITSPAGYTPAALASPATAVTGDVRGTISGFVSATGANRLVVRQSPQAYFFASLAGLFGVPQYTTF